MSTKFYIKDNNGNYASFDGNTRYTLLEGKTAYEFLKTEDGKRRCFHIEIDESGDKLGIETDTEIEKKYEAGERHARYLREIEAECNINVVSANKLVSVADENDIEMIEIFKNEETDMEGNAMHNVELHLLQKALRKLTPEEYDLIYQLYLAKNPLTVRELGKTYGVHFVTISKRHKAILKKLKKFFNY